MAEMQAKIETRQDTAAKFAAKLGADQPSVFDVINRSSYATEDAYLDALTLEEMRRSNPTYRETRSRLALKYRERQEREQRAANDAAYKEIRSTVQLDHLDQREIDTQAAEMARRDLAAGRISASGLGKAIEDYAKQLAETRKDTKASNQLFNAIIRGKR